MLRHLRLICSSMLVLCGALASGACVTGAPSTDSASSTQQKVSNPVVSAGGSYPMWQWRQ